MKPLHFVLWVLSLAMVSAQDKAPMQMDVQRDAFKISQKIPPVHPLFPNKDSQSLGTSFSAPSAAMKRAERPPSHCLRAREFPAQFDTLSVSLKLANKDWAGTNSDVDITITVNDKKRVPAFKGDVSPSVNAHQTITLKAADYFGAEKISLTDLKELKIYAYHNGHAFDAFEGLKFELEGVVLIATDNERGVSYNNVQYESINEWIAPSSEPQPRKTWNLDDSQWHASKPGKANAYGK
ncbi:hypothetical protein EYZ11_013509 [Aspergillus tanneri]|uniref:Uncharacterized protein n=1 Tax=Aspergillus tanneri TaxID=1220188 RepID=A0A4S3IXR0_9EURO|nr:uncharacterized protein ATNIH1004_005356 [Aspergillus tanneri]KAA8646681.1 hypothetical protein ATNIH1004_005356 [Aspergillus tanneri]THC87045.1 hypothetical protein EYZ11_013509 [Aspergillus tanneri]